MSTQPNPNGTAPAVVLPPHNVEAEEAILGLALHNPETLHDVLSFLRPSDFFILRHEWIFEAMAALVGRDAPVDYMTVANELRTADRLDEAGGTSYLVELLNRTIYARFSGAYGRIVQEAALRRGLLSAASQIAVLAHDESQDITAAIDEAQAALSGVTQGRPRRELRTGRDIMSAVFDRVEAARMYGNTGLPTGFADLDRMLGGLQKTDFIILAGRPGMGKTSLMLSMALNGMQAGTMRPVIFSLEMSAEQLAERWVSALSGVTTDKMRSGQMTDAEFSAFTDATGKVEALPFVVDETANLTAEQFRAKAARAVAEHRANLIIVDYLQLMEGETKTKEENRNIAISTISRTMKQVARKLNVPVVAAAQLNRAVEGRADKRPQLSDLRDSGSLEQDADVVMFITREDMYNENSEHPNQADIIIAKHRNGPTGTVPLYFKKETTQFANLAKRTVNLTDAMHAAPAAPAALDLGGAR